MSNAMKSSSYEVLGIGTPMIDHIMNVSYDFLGQLPGIKGGSISVDYDHFLDLIRLSHQKPKLVIGGSATNTIKGLVNLGRTCALFGKLGDDEPGKLFRKEIEKLNIFPYLQVSKLPTSQVACLVSPDHERTMRSFLGAGKEVRPEDFTLDMFKGAKVVHIEGYLLAYEKAILRAVELAKQSGARVSFDLSCVEIVTLYANKLLDFINLYVDILFANEKETYALIGRSPDQCCSELKNLCEVAVVTMGKKGSWAARGDEKIYQNAFEVDTKDTTGAGDLFASGFLHGYLSNLSLEECSRYGSLIASEVVQIMGADIPAATWKKIIKLL